MTIRTGKGGRYRYYACSMTARQGPTACDGMAVPIDKLDDLVARHLEDRLLQSKRLERSSPPCSTGGRSDPSASMSTLVN